MKLIYVISLGHSGSTLLDCILGTHPEIHSSGEVRYLQWQLERTLNEKQSIDNQNVCSCGKGFRDCLFWSPTIDLISHRTNIDISNEPMSFETAFFNQGYYEGNDKSHRSLLDKIKTSFSRRYLQHGFSLKYIKWLEPRIDKWIYNSWLLYESMSTIANKPVVVDSSKHLTFALFLQQSKPKNVIFLFLHRSMEGLVSSYKKRAQHKGDTFSVKEIIERKQEFNKRIDLCKKYVPDLTYFDVTYEEMVKDPLNTLNMISEFIGLSKLDHSETKFIIDPSKMHLVAGNPMRYRGKQEIKYDDRWQKRLSSKEKEQLKLFKSLTIPKEKLK